MQAIINRIMRTKQHRRTGEKSFGEDRRTEFFVLGGEHVGESIARRLRAEGHPVGVVDETYDSDEIPGLRGDPSDVRVLEEAGVSGASTVVVVTPRDRRNLLIAGLVRAHFGVADTFVLVNVPDRYDLVAGAGHEPVCATTALRDTVVDGLETVRHTA